MLPGNEKARDPAGSPGLDSGSAPPAALPAEPARRSGPVTVDLTHLLAAGVIAVAIVSGTCSTNDRIDDVNARIGRAEQQIVDLQAQDRGAMGNLLSILLVRQLGGSGDATESNPGWAAGNGGVAQQGATERQ